MKTTKFSKGDKVVFTPTKEHGEVTSKNDKFVFVLFHKYGLAHSTSQACQPEHLIKIQKQ